MEIEGQTTEIEVAYEPDYEINDVVFSEPFVVLKPLIQKQQSWWANKGKVENLIAAFKMDLTIAEACVQAGISVDQYKYFCKIHPLFSTVKSRCKMFAPILAKQGLIADLKSEDGARSRQWYLERRQPHLYGRDIGAYTPPPPEAAAKVTTEAFLDNEGKLLVSRGTAEILRKEHGNEDGED